MVPELTQSAPVLFAMGTLLEGLSATFRYSWLHEDGAAQMEINLIHGDAMSLADQVFMFKRTAREAAFRHKMYATFMAKPMAREPGSAMHIHQSIVDAKTGKNVFSDKDGNPTQLFFSHIAGLQKYLPQAMALFAPNVNSFRRIILRHLAPINTQWGYDNRTAGPRAPISHPGLPPITILSPRKTAPGEVRGEPNN